MLESKYVMVGNIKTHYYEAGSGFPLVLLHSGEYGASAKNSWEYNIKALSEHFHVYALDIIGYGYTDKVFSFDDASAFRVDHITQFLKTMCIDEAYFMGNSLGGGMILSIATTDNPVWPIKKALTISGGGPNHPEAHEVLNNYDCTKEYMKKIHNYLFHNDEWKTDEYVEKRYQASLIPGAWETASAARLASPVAEKKELVIPDYSKIDIPVMVCAGDNDQLKYPDYAKKLQETIPNAEVHIFEDCGHCAHIEYANKFNELAINFFLQDK